VKPKPGEKYDDYQMTYAIRYLRGQEVIPPAAPAARPVATTKPN
jgi:hypothetical protein